MKSTRALESLVVVVLMGTVASPAWPAAGQSDPLPRNDDTRPAVAPDGSSVVFQSRRAGFSNLYRVAAGGGFPRRLTEAAGNNENPAWSPDGDLIAFDSDRTGAWQVFVMDADGENVRQLTRSADGAREPSFSRDGESVLFVSAVDGVQQVHRVGVAGGEPRALTTSPGDKAQPAASPDGRLVAFVSSASGASEIHVAGSNGSDERRVTSFGDDSPRRFVSGLGWTPEGDLVFGSNRGEVGRYFFRTSVYTMRPDGRALRRMAAGGGSHNDVSMALDGSRVAFDAPAYGGWDVFVVDGDGSHRLNLTASSRTEFFPTPTPDGERVVFQSERSGDRDIYVMNRDGTDVRNLTHHPEDDRAPSLSGDGATIAFASFRDSPWGDVYTMDAGGGNVTKVTPDGFFEELDQFPIATEITPDGRVILFEAAPILVQGEGHWDIWRIDRDGRNATRLTNTPGTARSSMPRVAPDGRSFLYFSSETGNTEIYRMAIEGGAAVRLTDTPASETYADWSPDGRFVYFSSNRDGPTEIYRMHADGSDARRLTHGAPDASHFAPRVSRNGRDIWLQSNRGGTTEIHRMNADGSDEVRVSAPWGPTEDDVAVSTACRGFTRLGQPHWSWTRNQIAFPGDCGGRRGIYVYDVAADTLAVLDVDLEGLDSPAWSTAGDRIAFNAQVGEGKRDLFVHDLSTATTRRVTTGGVWGGWVTWSPDDVWLNGYGPDEGERWNVFRVRLADGERVQVNERDDVDHTNLAESPDGGRFLYAAGLRIWQLSEEGDPTPVTPPRVAAVMPHWAPDGERFLFDGNAGGGWNLWVGNVRGGEPVELTRRPELDSNATWSPDGRTVVYLCRVDAGPTLCLVDVATRRARPLFRS